MPRFQLRISDHALRRYRERVDPLADTDDVLRAIVCGLSPPLSVARDVLGKRLIRVWAVVITQCGRGAVLLNETGYAITVLLVTKQQAHELQGRPRDVRPPETADELDRLLAAALRVDLSVVRALARGERRWARWAAGELADLIPRLRDAVDAARATRRAVLAAGEARRGRLELEIRRLTAERVEHWTARKAISELALRAMESDDLLALREAIRARLPWIDLAVRRRAERRAR